MVDDFPVVNLKVHVIESTVLELLDVRVFALHIRNCAYDVFVRLTKVI